MPSIQAAFIDFIHALGSIGNALLGSVLAVFQASLALGQELFTAVFSLFNAFVQLFVGVTQTAVGFVFANFFAILIIGGVYYWYTNRQPAQTRKGIKRA